MKIVKNIKILDEILKIAKNSRRKFAKLLNLVPPLCFPARSVRSPFALGVRVALSSHTPGIAQSFASHLKYTALLFGISGCIYVCL